VRGPECPLPYQVLNVFDSAMSREPTVIRNAVTVFLFVMQSIKITDTYAGLAPALGSRHVGGGNANRRFRPQYGSTVRLQDEGWQATS
jgi:hypothetical protein